jgi:hypothetical protein
MRICGEKHIRVLIFSGSFFRQGKKRTREKNIDERGGGKTKLNIAKQTSAKAVFQIHVSILISHHALRAGTRSEHYFNGFKNRDLVWKVTTETCVSLSTLDSFFSFS